MEILTIEAYTPSLLSLPNLQKLLVFRKFTFCYSEQKMLELTIKHEKCSQVSYEQGEKIRQQVS
jgi:hypothetical protein